MLQRARSDLALDAGSDAAAVGSGSSASSNAAAMASRMVVVGSVIGLLPVLELMNCALYVGTLK